jgi:hypothetical protein
MPCTAAGEEISDGRCDPRRTARRAGPAFNDKAQAYATHGFATLMQLPWVHRLRSEIRRCTGIRTDEAQDVLSGTMRPGEVPWFVRRA